MKSADNRVYVLGSSRIPFAKSHTQYKDITRKELMAASLNGLVKQYKLHGKFIGDTAIGVLLNSASDFNLAREALLETELDPNSPAYNIQRACGTGLEASWQIALKAFSGVIDLGIAGGIDSNSDLPIEVSEGLQKALISWNKAKTMSQKLQILTQVSLHDLKPKIPSIDEPRTHLSMGDHCELMVKQWRITREEQDKFALGSHQKGSKAYEEGFFKDLVIPYKGINRDGTLREDTSLEKLSKLKPVFDLNHGTLTAGNSSPLTDGSACVLIGTVKGAEKIGIKPLAEFIDFEVAAVDFIHGEGLLMAPTKAVSELLKRNHLTFEDFDFFEIHEAFAGQVLCNLKAWESEEYCKKVLGRPIPLGPLDKNKLNVVGSSLSVGHPFTATGARIVGTLAKLLSQGAKKRGLISICTAGGMGMAAILESA